MNRGAPKPQPGKDPAAAPGLDVAVRDVPASETADCQPPEGYRFEWASEDWGAGARPATVAEHRERKCRRPLCGGAPVMALHRSNGWWLYCADHLYGRRIRDGVVEHRAHIPEERSS